MSFVDKLGNYLKKNNVEYISYYHNPVYSVDEQAKCLGVDKKYIVKTFLLKTEDEYAIVILPASSKIKIKLLAKALNKKNIGFANNLETKQLFPDCELGAIPAFGNLFGIPVYAATIFNDDYKIIFNAGTHTDTIKMHLKDYIKLEKPRFVKFPYTVKTGFLIKKENHLSDKSENHFNTIFN